MYNVEIIVRRTTRAYVAFAYTTTTTSNKVGNTVARTALAGIISLVSFAGYSNLKLDSLISNRVIIDAQSH